MAKRFTAHEIAMSIKEINSIKDKCVKLEHDSRKMNEQITSLRSLVNELEVALSGSLDIIGNVAEYIEVDCGTAMRVETYREILANALEVCK